jgi:hypothetical protein
MEHDENLKCSICSSDFDLDGEGGEIGYFGMMPVAFCPWCLSSMLDMCRQLFGIGDDLDD